MPSLPPASQILRRVEANVTAATRVGEYLTRVKPPPEDLQQVSVTRLVNPGRAYYDLVSPLPEGLAAQQKRLAGTGAHDVLEDLLARGVEYTELWLHGEDAEGEPPLDRITARLDACERLPDGKLSPTEIKNVGTVRPRPSEEHLEQLGMYCALLGVTEGHLLAVHRDDLSGRSTVLTPLKVRYPDLASVRRTMAERRDRLTEAVRDRDPSRLPACPWAFAGCKYRVAGICDCPSRPRLETPIADLAQWSADPGYLALLRQRAERRETRALSPSERPPLPLSGFLTPRKVYFRSRPRPAGPAPEEGTAPEGEEGAPSEQRLSRANVHGLERQIQSAVFRTHPDRASREEVPVDGTLRPIALVDGKPFLVRIRMVRRALSGTARDLSGDFGVPEDLRQLLLRAALRGVDGGRMYVWNWKLPEDAMKLQVFDVEFLPEALARAREYAHALPDALGDALEKGDFRSLPLCPRWMCPPCPYREECRPDETGPSAQ
jgi:hypothetical protein